MGFSAQGNSWVTSTGCELQKAANREAILRLFPVSDYPSRAFEPFRQIFPGWTAPIVRKAADGDRAIAQLPSGEGSTRRI